ncbi:Uncharacterised protein [Staphylococcus epidermidis]|nr:Uncharacterised protein [Staphylococcus epidermidis]
MNQDKVEKPLLTYDSLDNLDQIFQIKIRNDEFMLQSHIGKTVTFQNIREKF